MPKVAERGYNILTILLKRRRECEKIVRVDVGFGGRRGGGSGRPDVRRGLGERAAETVDFLADDGWVKTYRVRFHVTGVKAVAVGDGQNVEVFFRRNDGGLCEFKFRVVGRINA